MGIIDEVRALIRATELPEALTAPADGSWPWTADRLAESFNYQIRLVGKDERAVPLGSSQMDYLPHLHERLVGKQIEDEHAVSLGLSKVHGLPHLPRGMGWPKGLLFAAQLNLEHLARVDRSGWLPSTGMLYFFFNGALEHEVIHWTGPIEKLEVREYPDASTVPDAKYYLEDFLRGVTVDLQPYGLFRDSDSDAYDHRELHDRLPAALIESVSSTLGAPVAPWDFLHRLYGTPLFWQGEDDDIIGLDDEGGPIWREPESRLLLFQTQLGDATVHFMCAYEAAARGDFSGVEITTSST